MFKSVGSNWALSLLQIIVLLKLTPFVLGALGPDANGVWITIVSLTGFLRLLVLGVPMASVRYVAEHVGKRDLAGTNRAIATCLGLTLGMGAVALFIGVAQYFAFDSSAYLGGALGLPLDAAARDSARLAFILAVVQVAAAFATRLPYGILDAHGDFVTRNAVMAGELLLRLGLTIGVLAWKPSLALLAAVLIVTMTVEFIAAWICVVRRHPGVRFSLRGFDRSQVRGILSFSAFAMLLNVGTLLAFRSDALVIGAWLDARAITEFDLGNKFFEPLTGFVIGIGAVAMPLAARFHAAGSTGELRVLLLKWSKIALSLVLFASAYLLVLGREFLTWWTGPEFAAPAAAVLRILLVSFLVYWPVRGVALPILMGLGRPARPAIALLAMGVVNVALSIALVEPFGIQGVALGTALPNVVFAAFVLAAACGAAHTRLSEYVSYVAFKPLVGWLAPLGVCLFWKYVVGVRGALDLIAAGMAMSVVFALTWILFVYRGDPHLDLPARISGLLRRARVRSAS